MEIISDLSNYSRGWDECVLTMGDFDGIHKGHRRLFQKALNKAEKQKVPAVLLTYDPSPKKILKKLKFDSNIFTKDEKLSILQEFPFRTVIFLPFTKKTANLTAKKFLLQILVKKLNPKVIIIGYDHKFGKNRHGHYSYLKMAGKRYGFYVEQIKPVRLFNRPASSSWIRELLLSGKIEHANRLLSSPYFIKGIVILGKQRGRLLGVPTANLHLPSEKLIPKEGVYACIAKYGAEYFKAVVNIGYNPTFSNTHLSVEAHILNFGSEIYGEKLQIYFLSRIRDEKKFSEVEELKKQIIKDIQGVHNMKFDLVF